MSSRNVVTSTEDREREVLKLIQNSVGRNKTIEWLDIAPLDDALGFEIDAFGRVFRIVVIERT